MSDNQSSFTEIKLYPNLPTGDFRIKKDRYEYVRLRWWHLRKTKVKVIEQAEFYSLMIKET